MDIVALSIDGAMLILPRRSEDERGFFARTVCEETLMRHGLIGRFTQSSISFNRSAGTVRGMHYSVGEHAETKLVRCTAGSVYDVLVDLRCESPSFGRIVVAEISAKNRNGLYVPAGVAHGFQTLVDDTELLYMIDKPYEASAARGVRYDDMIARVEWPLPISVIAQRDLNYSPWRPL